MLDGRGPLVVKLYTDGHHIYIYSSSLVLCAVFVAGLLHSSEAVFLWLLIYKSYLFFQYRNDYNYKMLIVCLFSSYLFMLKDFIHFVLIFVLFSGGLQSNHHQYG